VSTEIEEQPAGPPAPPRLRARVRAFTGPAGGLRRVLLKAVAGSAGLKGINMVLTSGVAIVLARVLGPAGYGVYAVAMATITMLGVPSQLGLPTLLMREVARHDTRQDWSLMRGLLRRGNQAVVVMSLLCALGVGIWLWVSPNQQSAEQLATLGWALFLLPLVALGGLRSGALRGLRRVVEGQVPEMVIRPLGTLLLVGGLVWAAGSESLTPSTAMALNVLATFIAFLAGAVLLHRAMPPGVRVAPPVYDTRAWLRSVIPLSMLGGVQLINGQADILMLAALATPEDVGIYRVIVQLTSFVLVGAVIVNSVQAPYLARFHAEGNLPMVKRMAQQGSRALFLSALAIAAVLVIGGKPILAGVFGPEYVHGYVPMVIWCAGIVFFAEQGSLIMVMNMAGHEKDTVVAMAIGAAANVLFNFVAIPRWGMLGAASATMLSTLVWRTLLRRQLRLKLGMEIGALGTMRGT
jgi:O-antigen/teichoic acid export membrane protein